MGTGIANPSGIPEFTPDFNGVRVDQPLIFCAIFCSFFVHLPMKLYHKMLYTSP
jgi:hypothetical protein